MPEAGYALALVPTAPSLPPEQIGVQCMGMPRPPTEPQWMAPAKEDKWAAQGQQMLEESRKMIQMVMDLTCKLDEERNKRASLEAELIVMKAVKVSKFKCSVACCSDRKLGS